MKSSVSFILTGVVCLCVSTAQATLLFQDGFNYTAGNGLGGNINSGSGRTWGPGNNNIVVSNANLTYSGLQDLGGNALSVSWGLGSAGSVTNGFTTVTSGQLYYSFLFDMTAVPTNNQYITAMNPGTGAPNGSSDAIDMYINSNGTIGLRTAGKSTLSMSSPLSLDTTYLIVLEYDFDTTTANLFLNPVAGDVQPGATLTLAGSGTVASIDDVGFKAQSTGAPANFLIDNLLIGTTWGDVTPIAPVPEPSVLALSGVAFLGLAAAIRRRRK